MHNFPKVLHGRDILGGGEAISFEDAVKYSTWCMTDAMKSTEVEDVEEFKRSFTS